MDVRPTRRLALLLAATTCAALLAAGCGGGDRAGVAPRATLTPAPIERFAGCDVKPRTARWKRIDARAERAMARGHGFDRSTADAWLRTQGLLDQLIDAMRGSSSAGHYDFVDAAFHNSTLTLEFNVRNHRHDAAIRDCARRLRLFGRLQIIVHRWTPGQLDEASGRLYAALRGRVRAKVFETDRTYGDRYNIRVYEPATPAELRRIQQAAERIGVGFKIFRVDGPKPVSVPL